MCLPEFIFEPLALGNILDRALVVKQVAAVVVHAAGVFRHPVFAAVLAVSFELEALYISLLGKKAIVLPATIGADKRLLMDVVAGRDHFVGRGVPRESGHGRVGRQELTVRS